MPLIYKRFTDKTAEEWRQIYKVLDLSSCPCPRYLPADAQTVPPVARIPRQEWFRKSGGRCPPTPIPSPHASTISIH